MNFDRTSRASFAAAVVAAVVSATVAWQSARHLDTLWDEQVDHDIAVGLSRHPLAGEQPPLDGSQFRLPMYVNALVFRLAGRDDLATARGVSCAAGAATVLAAWALARQLFGPLTAAVAAFLLGFSPYFLSFARISMTEGDVFFALFMTAATWAFVRYLQRPDAVRWLVAGLLLGLAVGTKLYAAVLIVVFAVLVRTSVDAGPLRRSARGSHVERLHRVLGMALLVLLLSAAAAAVSKTLAVVGWGVTLASWAYVVVFVLRRRVVSPHRWKRYAGMVAFAAVTFFALMPVHLTEHGILREVARRALRWDHRLPLALWSDHLRLYSGIVMVKLTVPLGVLTAAAMVFAAVREREDGRWRPCIVAVVLYVVALCFLPLRQTFYLMGVYPSLMILLAGFIVHVGRRLGRQWPRARAGWAVLIVGLLGHLGYEVCRAYPHYHLHGHRTIGNTWLGAEARGYRNLIQTPSDGVETLIGWCNEHAFAGARVVSYLWEDHIIRRIVPADAYYLLTPRGLSPDREAPPPPPSIADADFVLLHINNWLGYGDRPPDLPPTDELVGRFKPVFTVKRGGMAVGWVYSRR